MANVAENIHSNAPPISAESIRSIRSALAGKVCMKGEPGYDEARTIWNAMIDRSPAIVMSCASAADVVNAVRFANMHDLDIAVRGGGHNIAGNAVCDGGLLIDLSRMKSVHVDPTSMRARVDPGCTLADVDRETQAFSLVLPTGINST